jgi:hypothetical protein
VLVLVVDEVLIVVRAHCRRRRKGIEDK